ncbi:MAG: hypothetical protein H6632_19060, partial [Anaerolineales bacterium]|nr:hypothetical protein [Anaerolineales bacterium]
MSQWQWARTVDRAGVARYVDADRAARVANLTLTDSAYDLSAANDGRRRLAQQIYQGLLARAEQGQPMAYDRPEYNYEQDIQTIRPPEDVLVSPRQGTCLDLSLLYAGLCLHYGLLPLVVLLDGHAYVAVSLTHSRSHDQASGWDSFGRQELAAIEQGEGLLTDAAVVAQLIAQGAYLPVECTGFAYTHKLPDNLPEGQGRFMGYLSFEQAVVA